MTHRTAVELLFSVLMLVLLTLSSMAPESKVLQDLPFFLVLAMAVWFDGFTRRHPEERTRYIAWLWPGIALLTAVQFVWFAKPGERLTAALLGGGLVIAASALAIQRRRRG